MTETTTTEQGMDARRFAFVLAVCAMLASSSHAYGGWTKLFGGASCWPDCVGTYCCDDYCAKCPPTICPVGGFCCDDYCAKPIPCVSSLRCFECDDYCRKPLPALNCPPPPWWKRPPAAGQPARLP